MKHYIQHDDWKIIENGFQQENNRISESLFSLGNGRMGQRANFEEQYSGDTLQGSYVAGVYYPDKTRVGWWKNGYPEYFAKVINAPSWIGIDVEVNGVPLDLNTWKVTDFKRVLDMKSGVLQRSFQVEKDGMKIAVKSSRFCSIVDDEVGAIAYTIKALNKDVQLKITPYIDADIVNEDSNYDEKFWEEVGQEHCGDTASLTAKTKKLDFHVCTSMAFTIAVNGKTTEVENTPIQRTKYVGTESIIDCRVGTTLTVNKYASVVSSENYPKISLMESGKEQLNKAVAKGFEQLLKEQKEAWAQKWVNSDIKIKGDTAAQQGIRFNIFQMHQTYSGEDARLNIGPKGFTGEKYGGSTYWDTEAYCLPFYLSTADQSVARNLLVYRYKHLQKAIENAEKLGFTNGAALYPMVTMNGEECHNEWEITFEEIHRNGAIAFAIYDYIRYTDDAAYLSEYGLEVLMGIARFWAQRVNFSNAKQQYVMLGVTGPNEYENNVNNNWYTNTMACWCMNYAMEALAYVKENAPKRWAEIQAKTKFDEPTETSKWKDIIENMYFPKDEERQVFLQQDGFLDKELKPAAELGDAYPIHQNWSWDRILRSCYIKQADVLQGFYFLEDQFDMETLKRNFDFYEPMTVHESSLSPCVHSILAAKLGYKEKAYEMYLRTARLDLDDYNNDTKDGCHITSMGGTWMSVVKGFGGMRVRDGQVHFNPFIPDEWEGLSFKVNFRENLLNVEVNKSDVVIENLSEGCIDLFVFGEPCSIEGRSKERIELKKGVLMG